MSDEKYVLVSRRESVDVFRRAARAARCLPPQKLSVHSQSQTFEVPFVKFLD